jgi:hypothetical protein
MKLNNLIPAYQLQRKFNEGKPIIAYKVGASNYRSASFFDCKGILLGGLHEDAVIFNKITKDYPVAEVEIISKVRIGKENKYELLANYLGIECPNIVVDNPTGSPFICIADNCSSGDLIVYQEISKDWFETISVYVNDILLVVGSSTNLRLSVDAIIQETVTLIRTHSLPLKSNEILIATGGLTEVFSLSLGDKVTLIDE